MSARDTRTHFETRKDRVPAAPLRRWYGVARASTGRPDLALDSLRESVHLDDLKRVKTSGNPLVVVVCVELKGNPRHPKSEEGIPEEANPGTSDVPPGTDRVRETHPDRVSRTHPGL
jgi:hypothetical protein